MKKLIAVVALVLIGFTASHAIAAQKTYQVTGPVVEMNSDSITVQKGKEKWEIARGSASVPDTVKVGDVVKVEYSMTADTVTPKAAKAGKAPATK